ncbi:MAG: hypothetical protein KDD66_04910 [Bdellovibrionales bacterium]|nr:hypothetical protein [Bdellovibrionales bacterium]
MTEDRPALLGDIRLQLVPGDHPLSLSRMAERGEHMRRNFAEPPWDFTDTPADWVKYLSVLAEHGGVFVDAIDTDRGGRLCGFCVGIPHVDEEVVAVTELGKFGLQAGDAYCAAVVLDSEYRGRRDGNGQKVYPRLCDARHMVMLAGNSNPAARFWVRTHVDCHAVRRIFERAGYEVAGTGVKEGLGCSSWSCVVYSCGREVREDEATRFFYDVPVIERPSASRGGSTSVPVEGSV